MGQQSPPVKVHPLLGLSQLQHVIIAKSLQVLHFWQSQLLLLFATFQQISQVEQSRSTLGCLNINTSFNSSQYTWQSCLQYPTRKKKIHMKSIKNPNNQQQNQTKTNFPYLAGGTSMFEETTLRFCSRRQTERVFSFSYSWTLLVFLVSAVFRSSSFVVNRRNCWSGSFWLMSVFTSSCWNAGKVISRLMLVACKIKSSY